MTSGNVCDSEFNRLVAKSETIDAARKQRDNELAAWLRDRASRYGVSDNGRFALIRAAEKIEKGEVTS